MKISFVKAHGLGNDFIIAEDTRELLSDCGPLSRRLCDRHTGIGADGLVLVRRGAAAPFRMDIFNSDGSRAEMCGNALRCFCKYLYERGLVREERFCVQTGAGVLSAALRTENGRVLEAAGDMGAPDFEGSEPQTLRVLDRDVSYWPLIVGVPHAVTLVERTPEPEEVARYGRAMEWAPPFPCGVNVEFVEVLDPGRIRMRVWERGCGLTLACGTGATAAAACCMRAGLCGEETAVELPLGTLWLRRGPDGRMEMRGPAEFVYEGIVEV